MRQNYKVLIADDEPLGRQLMEAVLIAEGYELLFATNGLEVINLSIENNPDLILLDVMMPEMDGFQVCEKIRNTADIKNTPIFLVTALEDKDSRIKGLNLGANDFISKPYNRIEVLAKVRNILKSRIKIKEQSKSDINSAEASFNINSETTKNILDFSNSFKVLFPHSNYQVHRYKQSGIYSAWCGQLNNNNYLLFFQVKAQDSLQVKVNEYFNAWLFSQQASIFSLDNKDFYYHFQDQVELLFKHKLLESEQDFWYILLRYNTPLNEISVNGFNQQVYIATIKNEQLPFQVYNLKNNDIMKLTVDNIVYLLSKNLSEKLGTEVIIRELTETEINFKKAAKINHLASLFNNSNFQESEIVFRMVF